MDKEAIAEFYRQNKPDTILIDNGDGGMTAYPKGEKVCDFDSATPVVLMFDAGEIVMDTPGDGPLLGSNDAWAACEECSKLILANDRAGLRDRAVKALSEKKGMPPEFIREAVATLQGAFWKVRKQ